MSSDFEMESIYDLAKRSMNDTRLQEIRRMNIQYLTRVHYLLVMLAAVEAFESLANKKFSVDVIQQIIFEKYIHWIETWETEYGSKYKRPSTVTEDDLKLLLLFPSKALLNGEKIYRHYIEEVRRDMINVYIPAWNRIKAEHGMIDTQIALNEVKKATWLSGKKSDESDDSRMKSFKNEWIPKTWFAFVEGGPAGKNYSQFIVPETARIHNANIDHDSHLDNSSRISHNLLGGTLHLTKKKRGLPEDGFDGCVPEDLSSVAKIRSINNSIDRTRVAMFDQFLKLQEQYHIYNDNVVQEVIKQHGDWLVNSLYQLPIALLPDDLNKPKAMATISGQPNRVSTISNRMFPSSKMILLDDNDSNSNSDGDDI